VSTNPNLDARAEARADVVTALEAEVRGLRERLAEAVVDSQLAKEESERRSLVDELTGLHNRLGFLFLAGQQLRVLRRTTELAALVLADIDGLRAANAAGGFAVGDELVMAAARAVRSVTRVSDVVGRIGGDEFAVFMACEDPMIPELVVARIERVAAVAGVSLTIGVATGEVAHKADLDELVATADTAMYRAKQLRRAAGAATE
jgi:diguanylate cyclase (GGDEF)-like protein